jgi:hypothetical protein
MYLQEVHGRGGPDAGQGQTACGIMELLATASFSSHVHQRATTADTRKQRPEKGKNRPQRVSNV